MRETVVIRISNMIDSGRLVSKETVDALLSWVVEEIPC
jgi:hypothetical protein